jgi:hypothetical protein
MILMYNPVTHESTKKSECGPRSENLITPGLSLQVICLFKSPIGRFSYSVYNYN